MPSSSPISSVNDFVVRFANVNGSGSASANEAVRGAGAAHGHSGRAAQHLPLQHPGSADLVRGAHLGGRPPRRTRRHRPHGRRLTHRPGTRTWRESRLGDPFYDCTKLMPQSKFRDITMIGVPLTAICNREYTDLRQRQLFKNIIYVGALSARCSTWTSRCSSSWSRSSSSRRKS